MGCDLTVFVEFFDKETQTWKLIKREHKGLVEYYERRLDGILSDDKEMIKATFNGDIDYYQNSINEYKSIAYWLETPRDYRVFAYLSDVRNYGAAITPYKYPYDCDQYNDLSSLTYNSESFDVLFGNGEDCDSLDFFHSITDYTTNELKEAISKLPEYNSDLDEDLKRIIVEYITNIFLKPLEELQKEELYKDKDFRFILMYDN